MVASFGVGVGGSVGGGPFRIDREGETCEPVGEGEHAASKRSATSNGDRMGFTVEYNDGRAHWISGPRSQIAWGGTVGRVRR